MASHGGYREPKNPAQVSGPGAMSRRTDGGQVSMDLPDAKYGENADYQDIQSGAPVPQANAQPSGPTPEAQALFQQLTPMGAPSAQPGTPITDGAQYGPGADQSAIMAQTNPNQDEAKFLQQSGILQLMMAGSRWR
jgi:hypothetical protein